MKDTQASPQILSSPDHSLWGQTRRGLWDNKLALIGLSFVCLISILCLLAPWIAPHSHYEINLEIGPTSPSLDHWLGTDILGRDLFSRILYGGRVSLMVGIAATLVALIIGVSYGTISGLAGGKTDRLMMRLVEIFYALPFTIFVILLTVIFGRRIELIFIAIGAVEWLTLARIIRGQAFALKGQEFIQVARVMGQGSGNIILKHLLPNLMGTIVVYTTLTIPNVMLLEAFISFLGLGIQAPDTSWGLLIKEGAESMEEYPWLLIFPSLVFSSVLFSLNFLGDGLRDILDPKRSC